MGVTYARAFINSHVVTSDQLMILEKNLDNRIDQLNSLGIAQIHNAPHCVKEADLIILAVKPQDTDELFEQMRGFLVGDQIILSIMAGVKAETIVDRLGIKKVIRAMPNLPSQIGAGMTAFTATPEVSRFELGAIQNLLATTGKTLNIRNEGLINAVTAISGSGPAYIYYFMDSMINAAIDMGMSHAEAELLVKQTFVGALGLFQQNSISCKEWIQKVASKGGTTEAAINHFNSQKLDSIIRQGAHEALKRAEDLGG